MNARAVNMCGRTPGFSLTWSYQLRYKRREAWWFMNSQGSAGNVIAALASFFIPGLGQLLQGRVLKAALMFVLAAVLWWIWMGWIIHLWSIIDAALFKRPLVKA